VTDTNRGDSHGDDVSESGDVIKWRWWQW
jgi:hypothetical protein